MKRPVGAVALCTALVIMIWLMWAGGPPDTVAPFEDGQQLYLSGRVDDIQIRQSYGEEQLWIYLDRIGAESAALTENQKKSQSISVSQTDISCKMICITEAHVRPPIGSRILVTGQFETISQVTNPGQFDYKVYYDSIGIGARLREGRILSVSEEYSKLREWLYRFRIRWKEKLYSIYPAREASVLAAMLLGDKVGLDSEVKELYQQNGIIHILSISGLHITLLGMSIYRALRRGGCPIVIAALTGGILLVLYGMLTGMGISAMRAIGMYLLRILAELLGRTYDMLTALGCTALVMLCIRPQYLNNSGFLLSFGSICGIGLLMPVLGKKSTTKIDRKIADWKRGGKCLNKLIPLLAETLWEALLPGVSITVFTLPIQLFLFYEIPLYSLWINLLVVPFVSTVMLSGLIVMWIPWLSWLAVVDILILEWYERLCHLFSRLPCHSWNPGAPREWQIVIYYLLIAAVVFVNRVDWPEKVRHAVKGAGLLLAVAAIGIRGPRSPGVTFLDVGQGECIVLQTEKEVYLFDCGSSSQKNVYEDILLPFLKYEGIQCLDGIFVSHPDADHISGILELLEDEEERPEVGRLILSAIPAKSRKEEFAELLDRAGAGGRNIPVSYMGAGTEWKSGSVSFRCLHPEEGAEISDSNAYSQCFLVRCGAFSMLLTGDVEGMGEEKLMQTLIQEEIHDISLLKVAHHGSAYSTPRELLVQLTPLLSVISCGAENPYGHPHEVLLDRLRTVGSRIMTTAEYGAVSVRIYENRMKVEGYQR